MSSAAHKRKLRNYRSRLTKRGIARFEVLGLDADRDLVRSLARRLAEDSPDLARIRGAIGRSISGEPPTKGGILAALLRSRLVGADLELKRAEDIGRKVGPSTRYLLDTNISSNVTRPDPSKLLLEWVSAQADG